MRKPPADQLENIRLSARGALGSVGTVEQERAIRALVVKTKDADSKRRLSRVARAVEDVRQALNTAIAAVEQARRSMKLADDRQKAIEHDAREARK